MGMEMRRMKREEKKRLVTRLARLFIAVLMVVLGIGIVGIWVYSGIVEKSGDVQVIHIVSAEDIFKSFQSILTGENTTQKADENRTEDEKRLQESIEAGEKVVAVECAEEEMVKLLFAGDILLDEHYAVMANLRDRGGNVEEAFSTGLLKIMREADAFMLNNEFTITNRGTPTAGKQFTFRANPDSVSFLQEIGVDVVSVANNHIYDYGEVSLLDTLDALEGAGIAYTGAGKNLEEAMKPVYLIANGMKIGMISATQIERNGTPDTKEATSTSAGVLRCMDTANLLQVIAQMEESCDYTILYIHWGTESQEEIDWMQEEQAPLYAKAGVDLIIGDHPHCLQKIDEVCGVPVIYSLGNFWFNSKTQNSCVVEVVLKEKKLHSFRFVPCKQEDSRTRLLEGTEKQGVLNYMRGISPNVMIDEEGYVDFG